MAFRFFLKSPETIPLPLKVARSSRHLFSRFETIPFLFKQCETTPGIIIVLHEFERQYATHGSNEGSTLYDFGLIVLYKM
jgi:hypothetical protein